MKRPPLPHGTERGVASLVVVMVLFFIVSLVAAYASRNLIFEQRTSANQYRSTQALEAADAGLGWALTMLNSGRITANCLNTTSTTATSFRERYLASDAGTGNITVRKGATTDELLFPTCVFDGTDWGCSCPSDGAPTLTAPAGDGPHPAFRIAFRPVAGQPGIVQLLSNGCTRLDENCLKFSATTGSSTAVGTSQEGNASVSVLVALTGGLAAPPLAALTARGNVDLGGAALAAYNGDQASGGIAIHAGGSVAASGLLVGTVAGAPGSTAIVSNDGALAFDPIDADLTPELDTDAKRAERMFAAPFNMLPDTFLQQPAAVVVPCPCDADTVQDKIVRNPGRPLWLAGNLTINGNIGSAAAPVLLVVVGDVDFGTDGANVVYGLVYVRAADWNSAGLAQVHGAVVAEGNVGGSATPILVYDAALLNQLRLTTGSFVTVPGSWKDFP